MLTEELPSICAHCKQPIYGVKCRVREDQQDQLHFGCLGKWRARQSDAVFQIALATELRSLKSHLKNQRRQLHKERWETVRLKSRRGYMQKTPQNNSDAQTTSQPAAPQFDEMSQSKNSFSVWSLATAFCAATKRRFANFLLRN